LALSDNKSHWVRDIPYREDNRNAYAGTSAQGMATLRNLVLGPRRCSFAMLRLPCRRRPFHPFAEKARGGSAAAG